MKEKHISTPLLAKQLLRPLVMQMSIFTMPVQYVTQLLYTYGQYWSELHILTNPITPWKCQNITKHFMWKTIPHNLAKWP